MNIALWLLQGLLAALFLATGSLKVFNYEKARHQAGQDSPTKGLTTFIGLSEMAGALGLVVPAAAGVLMGLVPLAALCLGVLMAGAAATHRRLKEPLAPTLVLSLLSLMVAVGRGWLVPL